MPCVYTAWGSLPAPPFLPKLKHPGGVWAWGQSLLQSLPCFFARVRWEYGRELWDLNSFLAVLTDLTFLTFSKQDFWLHRLCSWEWWVRRFLGWDCFHPSFSACVFVGSRGQDVRTLEAKVWICSGCCSFLSSQLVFHAFSFHHVRCLSVFIMKPQLLSHYILFDRCLKYGAIMELGPFPSNTHLSSTSLCLPRNRRQV